MMARASLAALLAGVAVGIVGAQVLPNVTPKDGYVPNAATAIVIAEAVLVPIYGQVEVLRDRPYRAIAHWRPSTSISTRR